LQALGLSITRPAKWLWSAKVRLINFLQLTFQEYLAAKAIAGMTDADQQRLLLDGE
jgi:hypothetical protein